MCTAYLTFKFVSEFKSDLNKYSCINGKKKCFKFKKTKPKHLNVSQLDSPYKEI